MHTVRLLTILVEHHQVLAYVLIFLGLIFEGEVTLISAGILMYLKAINLPFALVFICLGSLVKTFYAYYLGMYIHKKWNHTKFMKYIERRVSYWMPRFQQKPFFSIFISKFITYLNFSVIVFSGYSKVDFKTYLKAELSASIIWIPALLALGYFFSYTALNVSHEIWRFSLIISLFIIGFILFIKLIGWAYELFEEFENYNNGKIK